MNSISIHSFVFKNENVTSFSSNDSVKCFCANTDVMIESQQAFDSTFGEILADHDEDDDEEEEDFRKKKSADDGSGSNVDFKDSVMNDCTFELQQQLEKELDSKQKTLSQWESDFC